MAIPVRILLVAESDGEAAWLSGTLARETYAATCVRVADEHDCRTALATQRWDLVVCSLAGGRAPAALRALRERRAGVDPSVIVVADAFDDAAEASQRLGAAVCLRARGFAHLGPAIDHALREGAGRAEQEARAAFEEGQRTVLEHAAAGRPLAQVLEEIVLLVERQGYGMLCSILLLDAEAGRVRHGAAPHLPGELVRGIDGALIGPREGSCGAAAYLREVVVIDDLGTHPNWASYRHLALPHGLRSCWSSPILAAAGGDVLGTFAMYYREARPPTDRERTWVARATHLAAIAIGRDRAERAARRADERYRQIVDTAYEGVWLLDVDARTMFVNQRTARMLGHDAKELLGRRIVDFMDEPSRQAAEGGFIQRLRTASDQYEFRFRRKDGTLFWALISGSPIHDDRREVVGALALISDISELKRTEAALRQSEAELRVVFENAAIGMALVNAEGRLVKSNAALQQLLGCAEADLTGLTFTDFLHPDDAAGDLDIVQTFRTGARRSYQSERRFRRRDGVVVWGRLTASLVQPQKGVPRAVIAMVENVTERRQMEEAVRASERLRALIYSAVSDVLFYIGVEPGGGYRFLSVNPAFSRATGLTEAQVVGRALEEVIPEPSRALVIGKYQQAINEHRTVRWDEETPYPAGVRYGEVSITPIFDEAGVCTNLVGTVRDVTDRRLAEQRLIAQAALLDEARDAILVRDLADVVTYWNKGAERLYGWSSSEALGRRIQSLIYGHNSHFDEAKQRLLETGQWSGEMVQTTKAGQRLVVESSWTLIRDDGGRPASVLVINTDITARKSLETQIFHTQRLESLGTLAGGIAHDFNNLLTVITTSLAVATGRLTPNHPAGEMLSEAESAARRGAELVRRLLTFSRRDEAKRTAVKLQALVSDALALLRVTLPRTVRLETHFEPDAPEVLADATQIHQIVMNLGTNAVHAMAEGQGALAVRVERAVLDAELPAHGTVLQAGVYARLVVSDSGAGIDGAALNRIFDPFYTTKAAGEGTGLGLSVVHGIVSSHQGGIVVRSAPGRGTDFQVYFPAAPRAAASAPPRAGARDGAA